MLEAGPPTQCEVLTFPTPQGEGRGGGSQIGGFVSAARGVCSNACTLAVDPLVVGGMMTSSAPCLIGVRSFGKEVFLAVEERCPATSACYAGRRHDRRYA